MTGRAVEGHAISPRVYKPVNVMVQFGEDGHTVLAALILTPREWRRMVPAVRRDMLRLIASLQLLRNNQNDNRQEA